FCIVSTQVAFGQARDVRLRTKGYVNPQEIVSLDSTMRMDQALTVINELSKQFAGKVIVDLEKRRNPIGVYIVNQHWRDALEMILARQGLTYIEEADFIQIVPLGARITAEGQIQEAAAEPPPTLDSRDVKISAVFFNTNLAKLQDYGISWNFYRAKRKEPEMTGFLSAGMDRGDTAGNVPPTVGAVGGAAGAGQPSLHKAIGELHSPPEFKFANLDLLIKFFASKNLGEVLTSPEVVVRNGKKGRIQVGQDIYITTRDIAGNTVNQQVSTGTIIEVTPVMYTQSDTDFIYLDIAVEQSDAIPGVTPTINRNIVKTHALLYDGEETVIGGMYTTREQEIREGIPVLKDLPWWFLGLRYIFGSESKSKTKVELIILLKAELIPAIRDRMATTETQQNIINNKRREYQKEFEKK
ncbi:MAG: type II and III secretion system protein, partial [Ignavibacteriae bacterium]|nr:type II and III secretion system protein [Ignavibacteriota bacterium]